MLLLESEPSSFNMFGAFRDTVIPELTIDPRPLGCIECFYKGFLVEVCDGDARGWLQPHGSRECGMRRLQGLQGIAGWRGIERDQTDQKELKKD